MLGHHGTSNIHKDKMNQSVPLTQDIAYNSVYCFLLIFLKNDDLILLYVNSDIHLCYNGGTLYLILICHNQIVLIYQMLASLLWLNHETLWWQMCILLLSIFTLTLSLFQTFQYIYHKRNNISFFFFSECLQILACIYLKKTVGNLKLLTS